MLGQGSFSAHYPTFAAHTMSASKRAKKCKKECELCWRLCEVLEVREVVVCTQTELAQSRMVCKLCALRELCATLPGPVLVDIAHFVGLLRTEEGLGLMLAHDNALKVAAVDLFLLSDWSVHTCNEGITTFSRHRVQIVKLHRSPRKDPAKFATHATVLTKDVQRSGDGVLFDMGGESKVKVCDDDDEAPPNTYTVTLSSRHHQKDIRTDTTLAICGRSPHMLSKSVPIFPSDPPVLKLVYAPSESTDSPRHRGDKTYTVLRPPPPQSVYTRPLPPSWVPFDLRSLPWC